MGPSRGLALLVCLVAAALGAATTARAAWGPVERPAAPDPFTLPYDTTLYPDVAVSPAGERLLAWTENGNVDVASRTPVRAWSAPVDISGVGPDLVMGASAGFQAGGQARVLWVEQPSWQATLRQSTRGPDGAWSEASDVADPFPSPRGALVPGPGGYEALYWIDYTASDNGLVVAIRPPGGAWGAPEPVSDPGGWVDTPGVVLDGRGNAIAFWDGGSSPEYAFRPAGGDWGAPRALSTARFLGADAPDVAFDSAGNALAVWNDGALRAAYRPAGGEFGTPYVLSTHASGGLVRADIAFDATGRATVLWNEAQRAVVADRAPGGTWSAATPVTPADATGLNARLSVLADGTTFVLATLFGIPGQPQIQVGEGTGTVVVYVRPPVGSFDDGTTLAPDGAMRAGLATNGIDSAAVVWVRVHPALGCAEVETAAWERDVTASPSARREACTTTDPTPAPTVAPAAGAATPAPGAPVRGAAKDTVAPGLKLYAPRRERTLRTGRVALDAWSNETCTLVLAARLGVHGGTLGRLGATLRAGKRRGLSIRLTRAAARRLTRALGRQTRGTARLTVTATDASGNRRTVSRRTVLTR